ncbi:dihydrolipoyl dehydrogenase [Tsukamurella soli]|uniref:Dihydrolipoyl dehydrogenase n=1 Tax=Tsukamurella soli TaxID=644556 RepID=A0ABP8JTW8_9ACTN
MGNEVKTKVLVVGSGPGGYVAAIRAGQLGLDTTIVESERLGGTCLIRGCIPSKALIHVAGKFEGMRHAAEADDPLGIRLSEPPTLDLSKTIAWKETVVDKLNGGVGMLLKRAKVKVVPGWATFSDAKTCTVTGSGEPVTITAEHVILANGSIPVELPNLPFGNDILSSTEALSLSELPERLAVVGGGYIGLELGIALRKMGADVTVVEALDRILPVYDDQLTAPIRQWLDAAGITVHLGTKAMSFTEGENGKRLVVEKDGEQLEIPADKVLVTVGRRPNTKGWGLETMAVDMNGPFVKVDDQCKTSVKNVWAIGDLVGEPMLAHKASAQAEMVAEIIAGRQRHFRPAAIPAVCFTEPEIVSVGLSPDEAKAAGIDAITGVFPFSANGRALSMEGAANGGFVRVVARGDNHRVIGVQATGAHVSEMSGEFVHAIEMGAVLEDIAGTVHVHPTLTEGFHESALKALGHAIHI